MSTRRKFAPLWDPRQRDRAITMTPRQRSQAQERALAHTALPRMDEPTGSTDGEVNTPAM